MLAYLHNTYRCDVTFFVTFSNKNITLYVWNIANQMPLYFFETQLFEISESFSTNPILVSLFTLVYWGQRTPLLQAPHVKIREKELKVSQRLSSLGCWFCAHLRSGEERDKKVAVKLWKIVKIKFKYLKRHVTNKYQVSKTTSSSKRKKPHYVMIISSCYADDGQGSVFHLSILFLFLFFLLNILPNE